MIDIKKIIRSMDKYAPPVEFEPSVFFGAEKEEITKLGVCVDPTIDVIQEAKREDINMLISHHYPTERSSRYTSNTGMYVMVAHLRQDIAPEGNIDTFAEIIGIKNIMPFTIRYKGMVVPNGAITGDLGENTIRETEDLGGYQNFKTKNISSIPNSIETKELVYKIDQALGRFKLNPQMKFPPEQSSRVSN